MLSTIILNGKLMVNSPTFFFYFYSSKDTIFCQDMCNKTRAQLFKTNDVVS